MLINFAIENHIIIFMGNSAMKYVNYMNSCSNMTKITSDYRNHFLIPII